MLLPIDQFSVAALSSMAPLLLLLLHLVRMAEGVVPSALQEMRLKCAGTSEVKVTIDTPEVAKAKLGQTFEPWPQVDPCGDLPKTPSYILCSSSSCAPACLKNLEPQHIVLHTDKQLSDASRALILKIAPNEYHPNFAQLGTCTLEQGMEGDGNASTDALRSFSKTSVLFVSISFIILMVISLAWLVFYYVQRFRYAHAKDRLQRRLFNAARKALTRIQTRTLRAGEAILDTDCAVCIDPYQIADVVRELPCKHVYHKSCIDPWLLEHRTCPMCKADIVKHFGYHLSSNEGNRLEEGGPRDAESPEPPSSGSESTAFPYQGGHDHDFHFTPTTSPQLVMSSSTAKSFAIVPLTVHAKSVSTTANAPIEVEAGPSTRSERIVPVGQVEPATVRHASARAASQGQIVNLIQVRARAQSCTRSVPLRRAERPSSTRPAPIDTNQVV